MRDHCWHCSTQVINKSTR